MSADNIPGILPADATQPLQVTGAISYIPKLQVNGSRFVSQSIHVMYEHWYNNQLIYIGTCELENLFTCPDARENPLWNETVRENEQLLVRPILIDKHHIVLNAYLHRLSTGKPYCNTWVKPYPGYNRAIVCSDGRIFKSQTEAAKALGVPQSRISYHLARKPGYKTIKGFTLRPWRHEDGV